MANCLPNTIAPTINNPIVNPLITKVAGRWKTGCKATAIPATPPDYISDGKINRLTPRAIMRFPAITDSTSINIP